MRAVNRKSAPAVKGGKVQKKNDWALTPDYYNTPQVLPVIDRRRPGAGYRHLLRKKDIHDFIGLLPDWAELSGGLNAIVLAPGAGWDGAYNHRGVIHVCAWEQNLWVDYHCDFYQEHETLFQRLGIVAEAVDNGYLCKFTEAQAQAYQLLHILLHELGHHHDRITTKKQQHTGRGESYAEAYALAYGSQIWDAYRRKLGLP